MLGGDRWKGALLGGGVRKGKIRRERLEEGAERGTEGSGRRHTKNVRREGDTGKGGAAMVVTLQGRHDPAPRLCVSTSRCYVVTNQQVLRCHSPAGVTLSRTSMCYVVTDKQVLSHKR